MKQRNFRFLSLLLTAILILASLPSAAALVSGDADGNGKVSASDARLVLRVAARLETAALGTHCDMDGDGKISSKDARLVLRIAAKLTDPETALPEEVTVHFLDVGQADCILIERGPYTMLIDGGNTEDADTVLAYLKARGIRSLDHVVSTHAHEDHIGGLGKILEEIEIENDVFAPKTAADTQEYRAFLASVAAQGRSPTVPAAGTRLSFGGMDVVFLGPVDETGVKMNDTSIVLKLTFGETAFLFTGDAERDEELDLINSGADLSADVLKVGHHGSDSSTSPAFLLCVMPMYAAISVGEGNDYGHPDQAVLDRLADAGVQIWRTDRQGTIVAKTDGETVRISEKGRPKPGENGSVEDFYIGNVNSKIFHRPTCTKLPKERNRTEFPTRDAALEAGYAPCKICMP